MRKVIDSNYLQNPDLNTYLSRSRTNEIVLSDYLFIELYQTSSEHAVSKALDVLYRYREQIFVSKNIIHLCMLNGREKGLARRIIDLNHTADFRKVGNLVSTSRESYLKFLTDEHSVAAKIQLERMLEDVPNFKKSSQMIMSEYTKEELKIIREVASYTRDLYEKQVSLIFRLTEFLIQDHPRKPDYKSLYELTNTYFFRYALASVLLMTSKISRGGIENNLDKKIRNDMIDMHFVALSTYFDGLLSNDKNANWIYSEASKLIECIQMQFGA